MKIKGSYIKELRTSKKLTQKQLAELSQISESMVSKIELGVKSTKIETLKKIANALSTTMDDLVGGGHF
ncbi:helix-turn-helix domain-containing protein [Bacillus wiedmannii]|nr:helix-turn-helix transcriptional regulator [Bacillus wiedmannii]PEP09860.1 transcriptional regulator [Bacillus wiedmannii]